MAQLVKNPLAMQEAWVGSLGWEDLLEKGTATHSTGEYSPWGQKESEMTEQLLLSFFTTGTKGRGFISKIWGVLLSAF